VILFEHPCNERMRTLLRVEYLFQRIFFFLQGEQVQHHQIALSTLFEIFEVCERSDLRAAVLQDLDKQRSALGSLSRLSGVDTQALADILENIQKKSATLMAQGRIGQILRENEWLSSLRGRMVVPGGATPADFPAYQAWQAKPQAARQADLQGWLQAFAPLFEGVALILHLMRTSAQTEALTARQGTYQEAPAGKTFQLLRIWVARECGAFPEVSANKHVVWIRFLQQDKDLCAHAITGDIAFQLARCNV